MPPTWTQLDSLAGRTVDEVLGLERQIVVVQPNLAVREGNWEIEFFNSDRYNEARNRRAPQATAATEVREFAHVHVGEQHPGGRGCCWCRGRRPMR